MILVAMFTALDAWPPDVRIQAESCPNVEQQAFLDEYSELKGELDDRATALLDIYSDVIFATAGQGSVRRYLMDNPD